MEWKTLNTIRIYETDSHARRLQARVLSCEEGENGWLVELDRTIFYPTGGGQPCDTGTLGGADVTETLLRGETVLHRCTAALPVGADVTGEIDWARRLDLMQQHSGEHLVSGLIHARFGYENVGFHLGADLVTIDFNGEVDEQALQELERAANEAVWADFAPHIWYPEPDELAHLPYRSKKALTGAVRLVQFGDIDLCACCGTHVARTGEIGLIKLFSTTHFRGGSRIEMACGGRALAVLNALCAQNRDISVRLSAKPAAVARLASERTEAQQRAAALEDRLFALLAQDGQTLRFEPPMPPEKPPIFPMRFIFFEAPGPENCLTIWFIMSNCLSSWLICSTFTPAPAAMRRLRLWLSTDGFSRSKGVIDWMIASVREMAFSSSCAFLRAPMFIPGIMPARSCRLPMPLSWTS